MKGLIISDTPLIVLGHCNLNRPTLKFRIPFSDDFIVGNENQLETSQMRSLCFVDVGMNVLGYNVQTFAEPDAIFHKDFRHPTKAEMAQYVKEKYVQMLSAREIKLLDEEIEK